MHHHLCHGEAGQKKPSWPVIKSPACQLRAGGLWTPADALNKTMQTSATLDQGEFGIPARAGVRAYGLAALCVGTALLLRWLLDPLWADRLPFATFFLATLVV